MLHSHNFFSALWDFAPIKIKNYIEKPVFMSMIGVLRLGAQEHEKRYTP